MQSAAYLWLGVHGSGIYGTIFSPKFEFHVTDADDVCRTNELRMSAINCLASSHIREKLPENFFNFWLKFTAFFAYKYTSLIQVFLEEDGDIWKAAESWFSEGDTYTRYIWWWICAAFILVLWLTAFFYLYCWCCGCCRKCYSKICCCGKHSCFYGKKNRKGRTRSNPYGSESKCQKANLLLSQIFIGIGWILMLVSLVIGFTWSFYVMMPKGWNTVVQAWYSDVASGSIEVQDLLNYYSGTFASLDYVEQVPREVQCHTVDNNVLIPYYENGMKPNRWMNSDALTKYEWGSGEFDILNLAHYQNINGSEGQLMEELENIEFGECTVEGENDSCICVEVATPNSSPVVPEFAKALIEAAKVVSWGTLARQWMLRHNIQEDEILIDPADMSRQYQGHPYFCHAYPLGTTEDGFALGYRAQYGKAKHMADTDTYPWAEIDGSLQFADRNCSISLFQGLYRSTPDEGQPEWFVDSIFPGDLLTAKNNNVSKPMLPSSKSEDKEWTGAGAYFHLLNDISKEGFRMAWHESVFQQLQSNFATPVPSMRSLAISRYIDLYSELGTDSVTREALRDGGVRSGIAYWDNALAHHWGRGKCGPGGVDGNLSDCLGIVFANITENDVYHSPTAIIYYESAHDTGAYDDTDQSGHGTPVIEKLTIPGIDPVNSSANIVYNMAGGIPRFSMTDWIDYFGVGWDIAPTELKQRSAVKGIWDLPMSLKYGVENDSGGIDWLDPPEFKENAPNLEFVSPITGDERVWYAASGEVWSGGRIQNDNPEQPPFNMLDSQFKLGLSLYQVIVSQFDASIENVRRDLVDIQTKALESFAGIIETMSEYVMEVRPTEEVTHSPLWYSTLVLVALFILLVGGFLFLTVILSYVIHYTRKGESVDSEQARKVWRSLYAFLVFGCMFYLPIGFSALVTMPLVIDAAVSCTTVTWIGDLELEGVDRSEDVVDQLWTCALYGETIDPEIIDAAYPPVTPDVSGDLINFIQELIDNVENSQLLAEEWNQIPPPDTMTALLEGFLFPRRDIYTVVNSFRGNKEFVEPEPLYVTLNGVSSLLGRIKPSLSYALDAGMEHIFVFQPRGILSTARYSNQDINNDDIFSFIDSERQNFTINGIEIFEPLIQSLLPSELIAVDMKCVTTHWVDESVTLTNLALDWAEARMTAAARKTPRGVIIIGRRANLLPITYSDIASDRGLWNAIGVPIGESVESVFPTGPDRVLQMEEALRTSQHERVFDIVDSAAALEYIEAQISKAREELQDQRPLYFGQAVRQALNGLPDNIQVKPVCVCSDGVFITGQDLCYELDEKCTKTKDSKVVWLDGIGDSEMLVEPDWGFLGMRDVSFNSVLSYLFFENVTARSDSGYPLFPPDPLSRVYMSNQDRKDVDTIQSEQLLLWRDRLIETKNLAVVKDTANDFDVLNPDFDQAAGKGQRLEFLKVYATLARVKVLTNLYYDHHMIASPLPREMYRGMVEALPIFDNASVEIANNNKVTVAMLQSMLDALQTTYGVGQPFSEMVDCGRLQRTAETVVSSLCTNPIGIVSVSMWSLIVFTMCFAILFVILFKHMNYFRDISSKTKQRTLLDNICLDCYQDPKQYERCVDELYKKKYNNGGAISTIKDDKPIGRQDYTDELVNTSTDMWLNTPLHFAAYRGYHKVTDWLIGSGAELDARNTSSYTPLHVAAHNAHPNICHRLLEAGADYSLYDAEYNLPIGLVTQRIGDELVAKNTTNRTREATSETTKPIESTSNVTKTETMDVSSSSSDESHNKNGPTFLVTEERRLKLLRTIFVLGGARCTKEGHNETLNLREHEHEDSSDHSSDDHDQYIIRWTHICDISNCDPISDYDLIDWSKSMGSFIMPTWVGDQYARDSAQRGNLTFRDQQPLFIDDILIKRGLPQDGEVVVAVQKLMKMQVEETEGNVDIDIEQWKQNQMKEELSCKQSEAWEYHTAVVFQPVETSTVTSAISSDDTFNLSKSKSFESEANRAGSKEAEAVRVVSKEAEAVIVSSKADRAGSEEAEAVRVVSKEAEAVIVSSKADQAGTE